MKKIIGYLLMTPMWITLFFMILAIGHLMLKIMPEVLIVLAIIASWTMGAYIVDKEKEKA